MLSDAKSFLLQRNDLRHPTQYNRERDGERRGTIFKHVVIEERFCVGIRKISPLSMGVSSNTVHAVVHGQSSTWHSPVISDSL